MDTQAGFCSTLLDTREGMIAPVWLPGASVSTPGSSQAVSKLPVPFHSVTVRVFSNILSWLSSCL